MTDTYAAKIILDSQAPCGARLTTMELVMPRAVLADFNTHRKVSADHGEWVASISSNAGSSRAIPVEKRIRQVMESPWIPPVWGRNQRGMVAGEPLPELEGIRNEADWLTARNACVEAARRMIGRSTHKAAVNRMLEPWAWTTVIASATEWTNLFALRCREDADPALQIVANLALDAYLMSEPNLLQLGQWHLPYIRQTDLDEQLTEDQLIKLSVARCARVSYLTHNGVRDLAEDYRLFNDLEAKGHWSAFEHQAQALAELEAWGNFSGFKQARKFYPAAQENIAELPRLGWTWLGFLPASALEG